MTDYSKISTNWNYPTAIRFGVGRLLELADACQQLSMFKPLLVTDSGIAELPMVEQALAANRAKGLPTGIFSNIKPNPTGQNIDDGLAVYREGGYDGVIAFGGGSALDAAKAIALMAGQKLPLWTFEDVGDNWTKVDPDGVAPIVAVPTTAGTGSEMGRASVIVQEETHSKKIIFHPRMLPGIVIADPETTVGLPAGLTAATGMDALSHCLEPYSAQGFHPMADGIAVEAIRLIHRWLPLAVKNGADLSARANMLAAAGMGATAFQKGLGAMHSLAHPLGAIYDAHHGLLNAVLMPYVLEFNRPVLEERMTRLAAWIGLPNPSFTAIMDWILEIRSEFNIPETLAGLGVDDSRVDEIAEMAAADPSTPSNPIKAGPREMKQIFLSALQGK
ncbi:MAG: iron-containing alcohol dehydrogenase [Deltaproteobacteria bacterium]|nr:iron-containing alcohol dehydrogenase [Deltaproteobacteria bacterium]